MTIMANYYGTLAYPAVVGVTLAVQPTVSAISPALYQIKPTKINEDIVVPRNRVTEMLKRLRKLSEESGIKIVNFGHAGDGNIHVNIMVDKTDKEEVCKGLGLVRQIFKDSMLGGTISGEHGIDHKGGLYRAGIVKNRDGSHEIHQKGIRSKEHPQPGENLPFSMRVIFLLKLPIAQGDR
jgi:hypothetical protein